MDKHPPIKMTTSVEREVPDNAPSLPTASVAALPAGQPGTWATVMYSERQEVHLNSWGSVAPLVSSLQTMTTDMYSQQATEGGTGPVPVGSSLVFSPPYVPRFPRQPGFWPYLEGRQQAFPMRDMQELTAVNKPYLQSWVNRGQLSYAPFTFPLFHLQQGLCLPAPTPVRPYPVLACTAKPSIDYQVEPLDLSCRKEGSGNLQSITPKSQFDGEQICPGSNDTDKRCENILKASPDVNTDQLRNGKSVDLSQTGKYDSSDMTQSAFSDRAELLLVQNSSSEIKQPTFKSPVLNMKGINEDKKNVSLDPDNNFNDTVSVKETDETVMHKKNDGDERELLRRAGCGGVGRGFLSLIATPSGDMNVGACVVCQSIYLDFPQCPMCLAHGQVIGAENLYGLPPQHFDFRPSDAKSGEIGVFAQREVRCGAIIGPLKGKVVSMINLPTDRSGHVWPLLRASMTNAHLCLNSKDRRSNWLRNIQFGHEQDFNVGILLQYGCNGIKGATDVYFVSTSDIKQGEELLVNSADVIDKDWKCDSCSLHIRGRYFYLSHLMSAHRPIQVYSSFLEVICFLRQQANEKAFKRSIASESVVMKGPEIDENNNESANKPPPPDVVSSEVSSEVSEGSQSERAEKQVPAPCMTCDTVKSRPGPCPVCTSHHKIIYCPEGRADKAIPPCPEFGFGPSSVTPDDMGIRAGVDLPKGLVFGPMKGPRTKRIHVPSKQEKKHLWPLIRKNVCLEQIFIDTSDPAKSSWLRHLQIGTKTECNVEILIQVYVNTNLIYFVTTQEVSSGEELLINPDELITGDWSCALCGITVQGRLYYLDHMNFHKRCRENLYVPHDNKQVDDKVNREKTVLKKHKAKGSKVKKLQENCQGVYPLADRTTFDFKGTCQSCRCSYTDFENCPFCLEVASILFEINGKKTWCVPQMEVRKSSIQDEKTGVFTKVDLPKGCLFGPMTGQKLKISNIPADANMSHLRLLTKSRSDGGVLYTGNEQFCNALCHLQAGKSHMYNVALAYKDEEAYFVTTQPIKAESELFYRPVEPLYFNRRMTSQYCCHYCSKLFGTHANCVRHKVIFHKQGEKCAKTQNNSSTGAETKKRKKPTRSNHQNAVLMEDKSTILKAISACHKSRNVPGMKNIPEVHEIKKVVQKKPYHCETCGKEYSNRKYLHEHQLVHKEGNESKYMCKVCGKGFSFRSGFKQHVKRHEETFNWVYCELCGKRFEHASNLKVHLLTHSGIKPFQCAMEACDGSFTTKQCLQFHYLRRHHFDYTTMPEIVRKIPFTMEAHSGEMASSATP